MKKWKEITGGDIRILFAHLLVMGVMKRGNAAKYWLNCDITKLDFFGKYLSRNSYQMLLSNFHCAPNTHNPPRGWPGHDPLHKIRPLMTMCQENFHLKYRPGRCLSVDEGGCGFRGRVQFLTYNKDKPNKWAIKLFEVADSKNGFVCGLDIYCGKNATLCARNAPIADPKCSQTTKTVVGLLDSVQLLDNGHIVYLDNFYNSFQLQSELLSRDTYTVGTLRKNWKGNSKAVVNAVLKKDEAVYRKNGPVLCLKWCEKKRSVTMMSTVHSTVYVEVKKWYSDEKILKPLVVYDYTRMMKGVDKNDQFNTYYNPPRTLKWTTKLSIHFLSLCMTNAYILYTNFGPRGSKLDHEEFILTIARSMIEEGLRTSTINTPHTRTENLLQNELTGEHFPEEIPRKEGTKRKPSRPCYACNGSWADIKNRILPKRCSRIWCPNCKKVLCATPCFKVFHTNPNYKIFLLSKRFPVVLDNVE